MTRLLLVTVAALAAASSASAQYPSQPFPSAPYFPPQNVMPNIYNPRTQPLSPYLNLARGGNPGVNYYYGVRPGTVAGATSGVLGAPFTATGGNRPLFFPQLAAPETIQREQPGPGDVLPPAGHPVAFNNTMGYFPSPFGARGSSRPGLAGVGATRPPARK
jgi:hypothetical protein